MILAVYIFVGFQFREAARGNEERARGRETPAHSHNTAPADV